MSALSNDELVAIFHRAVEEFKGNAVELETAIGTLMIGQRFGWKVIFLINDKKTIRKYEKILGVSFRESMPEVGDLADKSYAWKAVQTVSNFWKAVKGETKGIRSPELGAK